jgi:hypothetical protein
MRRVLLLVVLVVLALSVAGLGRGWDQARPNGSSDGRYHTCGLVTDDGVTEHLDAYHRRCGEQPDEGGTVVDGHSGGDAGH